MFRSFPVALAGLAFATAAHADWAHRPSEAPDDTGSAHVRSAQGQRLDIDCGSGEGWTLSFQPASRVLTMGDIARMQFKVDDRPAITVPSECDDGGCRATWSLNDPARQSLMSALRAGKSLHISLGPTPLGSFPLAGSSAALDGFAAASRCPGL